MPLLPPSIPEEETGQFATGANFAVFGSSALPPEYFKSRYNFPIYVASHLGAQLDSFKKVLARIAPGDGKFLVTHMHACMDRLVCVVQVQLVISLRDTQAPRGLS